MTEEDFALLKPGDVILSPKTGNRYIIRDRFDNGTFSAVPMMNRDVEDRFLNKIEAVAGCIRPLIAVVHPSQWERPTVQ